ncbi:mucin-6-like isoform X2 [Sitodiplosis mosellana]|uniref:mucin-6-like isoform X2 n=1 Tax=Sitodiplosis mosellana TaxID=263140 RepID=UPI002443B07C|nr:mucin-6-like isoform X2 [Sitodiplosis mosellana]
MWSILVLALLCLHIGSGGTSRIDDIRSQGYGSQPLQNGDRGYNNQPQQAYNSPQAPQNNRNPSESSYNRSPSEPQNNQNQPAEPSKSCTKPKPFVKNAFKKCSTTTNSCTVQCFNNHQFANGKTSVKLLCNNGEWALENFQKTDKLACELKKKNSCPNKPATQQAEANCKAESCTITCEKGYALSDGSTSMEMMCKDGEWVPTNPEQSFPLTCEPLCENGREYKECSKVSEQSCGSAAEEETSSSECFEGCFCPDGTVENEGECIPKESCPCTLNGQTYEPGSEATKGSSNCKCEKGQWKCDEREVQEHDHSSPEQPPQQRPQQPPQHRPQQPPQQRPQELPEQSPEQAPQPPQNDARCEVFGDPHYITFDGKRYDFMGRCSYYLMRMPHMDIIAENGDCPWGHNDQVSCTKAIMMHVPQSSTLVRMDQRGRVTVNGIDATRNLPINLLGGFMHIRPVSQMARQVSCADGLDMMWDGYTYAYIDAPATHSNKTNGLCGNFDNNPENDFTTPEGDAEVLSESFGEKWRVKELCDADQEQINNQHPCQANPQNQQQAVQVCSKLRSNIFAACHQYVDPEPYVENCMYDMCACKGNPAQCKCTIFSAYANECSRNGKNINWRQSIKECAVKCTADQIFQECSDRCHLTCTDLQAKSNKYTKKCVAGCQCPIGKALDANNKCIPIEMCPKEPESTTIPSQTTEATKPSQTTETTVPTKRTQPTDSTSPTEPTESIEPTEAEMSIKPSNSPNLIRPITPITPEQSAKPNKVTNPMKTTRPTKPTRPTNPTKPSESTEATEPNKPTESTEPSKSTQPDELDEVTDVTDPADSSVTTDMSEVSETTDTNDETKQNECSDEKNERMSICIPDEPKTCANMNNYTSKPTGKCKTGCVCKDGYVLDQKLNQCVMPNFCSCENKGKWYIFGAQIKNGCKACICHGGEWYCRNTCQNKKDTDKNGPETSVDNEDASVEQDGNIDQGQNQNLNQKKPTEDKPRKNRDNKENTCQPVPMNESETIGLIEIYSDYGRCVNAKPIQGFAECGGVCNSKTTFNRATGRQEQKCECCSVSEFDKMEVAVECDDGSEQIALVSVPKSCSCVQGCGGVGGFSGGNGNSYQSRDIEPTENSEETDNRRKVDALGWLVNLNNLVNSRNLRVRYTN